MPEFQLNDEITRDTSLFFQGEQDTSKKKQQKAKWRDIYPQIIATCLAHSLVIITALCMTYSTVQIPHLDLNIEQSSWMVSLVMITTPVGAMMIGLIADTIGRKKALFIVCGPFIIFSTLTILADKRDLSLLYVSKVFAGVGSGMSTSAIIYISEIVNSEFRPTLLCLNSVFFSLGILIMSVLNIFLAWKSISVFILVLTMIIGSLLIFVPESPHWLMNSNNRKKRNNKESEAKKNLRYLNPNNIIFEKEWLDMNQVKVNNEKNSTENIWKKMVGSKRCSKPLLLLIILFTLQQLTGTYPIIFYALQIFNKVGTNFGNGMNQNDAMVMLGLTRFVMSFTTSILAKKYGRKQLLIISSAGVCVFGGLLSSNLAMKSGVLHECKNLNQNLTQSNSNLSLLTDEKYNSIPNREHGLNSIPNTEHGLNSKHEILANINSTHTKPHIHNSLANTGHKNKTDFDIVGIKSFRYTKLLNSEVQECKTRRKKNSFYASEFFSLILILCFVFSGALGVLVIPWTLIGELLPSYARATGSGFLISFAYIIMFCVLKIVPYLLDHDIELMFLSFSVMALLLCFHVYFFIPETKGVSFSEIDEYFS